MAQKTITGGIDRQTLKQFWIASAKYKKIMLLALLFPVGVFCVSTLVPLYVGRIIATVGRTGQHPSHYIPYFVVAAVVGVICNRIGFGQLLIHQATVMRDLQTKALDALLNRSISFHNNNVGGKLVSDAIEYSNAYGSFYNTCFTSVIPLVVSLIGGSIVIFWNSWELGIIIIGMTVFTVGSGWLESRRRANLRSIRLIATKKVTGHLADTILNVQTVKTFAKEDEEQNYSDELSKVVMGMRISDWGISGRRGNDRIAILLALEALFVLIIIRLVEHNPALLGIGIFAFSYTITLSNRLFDVNTMVRNIEEALLQASSMTEIMAEEQEIQDKPDAAELKVSNGKIDIKNIDFHYSDSSSERSVFKHLNISINPGEKIGLVGPSGGGKTTLTRLLLRFEDINNGEIDIDDQNIADVTQKSLRRSIAYVPQEPLLFHRSINENIAYSDDSASEAKIVSAAKAARADGFIRKLTKGYDTIVGERGVKLSGGQRQRVAIARAILKDSPILILDEATSALDSKSEKLIQSALWDLMENKTALVIAHRLSTIQKMDRILVLDSGKIIEQGSHKELLAQKGLYADLWNHQSGGFLED